MYNFHVFPAPNKGRYGGSGGRRGGGGGGGGGGGYGGGGGKFILHYNLEIEKYV